MLVSTPRNDGTAVSPHRLQALADGVFAIAMTLLVFDLSIPAATEDGGLGGALRDMWPEFLGYLLSFLVLGVFWLIHHMVFDSIKRYDTTLVWLNIVYLMFAAFIPFSTGLFGEHGATPITAIIYGLNMLVVFDLGWAIWSYATDRYRLVDTAIDPALIWGGRVMGAVYSLVMVPPILIAFAFPIVSFSLYGVVVAAFITATMLGRWELVAIWPARRHASNDAPERSEAASSGAAS
jgi:uncharacterized membrane protein